jgi:hypothetical protein
MDIRLEDMLDEIPVRAAAGAPPVTAWIRQEAARALQQRLGHPVDVEVGAEVRPAPDPGACAGADPGSGHPRLDRARRARGGGEVGRTAIPVDAGGGRAARETVPSEKANSSGLTGGIR